MIDCLDNIASLDRAQGNPFKNLFFLFFFFANTDTILFDSNFDKVFFFFILCQLCHPIRRTSLTLRANKITEK